MLVFGITQADRRHARDWENAAGTSCNLSELRRTLGDVAGAIADARTSANHADRSGNAFWRMINRTTLADALHTVGQASEASKLFEKAEAMQAVMLGQPQKLYSLRGYQYCDLLLAQGHAQPVVKCAKQALKQGRLGYSLLDLALYNLSLPRLRREILMAKRSTSRKGR